MFCIKGPEEALRLRQGETEEGVSWKQGVAFFCHFSQMNRAVRYVINMSQDKLKPTTRCIRSQVRSCVTLQQGLSPEKATQAPTDSNTSPQQGGGGGKLSEGESKKPQQPPEKKRPVVSHANTCTLFAHCLTFSFKEGFSHPLPRVGVLHGQVLCKGVQGKLFFSFLFGRLCP